MAAGLLATEGPQALSARRLGRELGTSSTTVYTQFGGMPALVREIMHEGFRRLAVELSAVEPGDDPVTHATRLALAYHRSAHSSPHLYRVMFGGSLVAGFELTGDDRRIGEHTFVVARDAAARCVAAGRFRPADPWTLARQLWCQFHGLVTLELAGYLPPDPQALRRFMESFAVGAGDSPSAAAASVGAA